MLRLILICLMVLATTQVALAQATRIYTCKDAKGRTISTDIPSECYNLATKEVSKTGTVLKETAAPLTEEQRRLKEIEDAKLKVDAEKIAEQQRQEQNLLAKYSGVDGLELARYRSLKAIDDRVLTALYRMEKVERARKRLDKEADFYKGKKIPDELKAKIDDNENSLKSEQAMIDAAYKEAGDVNKFYDEEKRKYTEVLDKAKAKNKRTQVTPAK